MAIALYQRDEFALITIERPEALNALSFSLIRDLGRAIDRAAESDSRALLFTGAGDKAFCAGADIAELQGRDMARVRRDTEAGQLIFSKLDALAIPSVAVINGYAFGGGLELALACTFRMATTTAKLGLPEIKLGLIPGYGGTQRLPRLIGEGRALDLILTGRTVDAAEALDIGLVHRVIETDPLEAAMVFARTFTGHGMLALKAARSAVQRAGDLPLSEGLKVEADLSTLGFRTEDAQEGMAAFLEKRKPAFKDR